MLKHSKINFVAKEQPIANASASNLANFRFSPDRYSSIFSLSCGSRLFIKQSQSLFCSSVLSASSCGQIFPKYRLFKSGFFIIFTPYYDFKSLSVGTTPYYCLAVLLIKVYFSIFLPPLVREFYFVLYLLWIYNTGCNDLFSLC